MAEHQHFRKTTYSILYYVIGIVGSLIGIVLAAIIGLILVWSIEEGPIASPVVGLFIIFMFYCVWSLVWEAVPDVIFWLEKRLFK